MTVQLFTTRYPEQVFARFEMPVPETSGYIDIPVFETEEDGDLVYGLVEGEDGELMAAEEDDDFIGYVKY